MKFDQRNLYTIFKINVHMYTNYKWYTNVQITVQ